MMAALIDRKRLKAETKTLLAGAQVAPKAMVALYLGIALVLSQLEGLIGDIGLASTFISILVSLLILLLNAGFVLYCMDIRRGEFSGFLTLFDGFSFVGKIIGLQIVMYALTFLWSMLFVIPGIIAAYRYRFALYNLYENPDLGIFEALNMSKQQTLGYKSQLFLLDLSYIGWQILATLPAMFYSSSAQMVNLQNTMAYAGFDAITAMPAEVSALTLLPLWGWLLLSDAWHLVVALFYLPHYQCVELGYFEIAKQTSGIGAVPTQQDYSYDHQDPTNGSY